MEVTNSSVRGLDLTAEIEHEFEDLKRRIKENRLSVSRDYSLIEDEVAPETFCDSSPDIEARHKKLFSKGLESLLHNATLPDSPTWQEKISDESFLRTERLVQELGPDISIDTVVELESSGEHASKTTDLSVKSNNEPKTPDESLDFNDTIEEMEYFLKRANLNKTNVSAAVTRGVSPSPKRVPQNTFSPVKFAFKVDDYVKKASPHPLPKCPTFDMTPFRPSPKSVLAKTPTDLLKARHADKYQTVLSPVRYYINNSPTVPMVKNVSPAKNYWDRAPPKNIHPRPDVKRDLDKENVKLPEMAYKSPKVTNVMEKQSTKKLPTNHSKVLSMVENVPKPVIIKHIKRDKLVSDFKNKASATLAPTSKTVEDSFAHLPSKNLDVSHCIGKSATRTRTLK